MILMVVLWILAVVPLFLALFVNCCFMIANFCLMIFGYCSLIFQKPICDNQLLFRTIGCWSMVICKNLNTSATRPWVTVTATWVDITMALHNVRNFIFSFKCVCQNTIKKKYVFSYQKQLIASSIPGFECKNLLLTQLTKTAVEILRHVDCRVQKNLFPILQKTEWSPTSVKRTLWWGALIFTDFSIFISEDQVISCQVNLRRRQLFGTQYYTNFNVVLCEFTT